VRIASLEVRGFRNLVAQTFVPGPGVNLVLGANGQGKTNLVEAIAFLSWMRSFRTSRSADLVASGDEAAWLAARVEPGGRAIDVQLGGGVRKVRIDGHPVRSARDCLELLAVACLSPDDPAVLEGGPDGRRVLLDRFVTMRRPALGATLARFDRLLKERNGMLRAEPGAFDARALDACEEALATAGAEVARVRIEALDRLAQRLPGTLAAMAGGDLGVRVRYASKWLPSGADPATAAERLRARLAERRPADLALGYTTAGPQADDVEVGLLGLPARGHASRGQKKVLMLAWKVAEALEHRAERGDFPVLVLDDALADLDAQRQAGVVACLGGYEGQSFVTSAVADAGVLRGADVFLAERGAFSREGGSWAGS
jgi:DNA replication and repair protein RecF